MGAGCSVSQGRLRGKPGKTKKKETPILMKTHKLKQKSKSIPTSLNVYLLWIYGLHYKKTLINNNVLSNKI